MYDLLSKIYSSLIVQGGVRRESVHKLHTCADHSVNVHKLLGDVGREAVHRFMGFVGLQDVSKALVSCGLVHISLDLVGL